MNKLELRKEFIEKFGDPDNAKYLDIMGIWWIDKIDQEISLALEQQRKEIVKELDSLVKRSFIQGEFKAIDVRSMMYEIITSLESKLE